MNTSVEQAVETEAGLVRRCAAGDHAAWDELFDKYYGVVARFVFQLSAEFSHEDAEEICQEVFVSLVRNIGSFQAKSAFQTWLLRIAANKAMDFRSKTRAAKRGGGAVHLSLNGEREGDTPPLDPPSPRPGPDALMQHAEQFAMLRAALDQLGDACREIIELRYYGDLSYAEIASELHLNQKTVSSRLSKCLDQLGALAAKSFSGRFAV